MSAARALALLLVSSASSTEAPVTHDMPVRCDEEKASCRDGCSLDYGTRVETRKELATCLTQCDERRDICLLRIVAKQPVSPRAPGRKEAPEPAKGPGPLSTPYTLPPTEYSNTPVRPNDTPPDEVPPIPRTATSASQLSDEPPAAPLNPAPLKEDAARSASDGKPARSPKKKKGKAHKDPNAP